ncbi:MFS transporter [Bacillus tianshenii]|nr:MFS transporter [Bacillus tianshenii]
MYAPASLWKNDKFVRMFSAYSVSIFGDWFDMIAVFAIAAYQWNASPVMIGVLSIIYSLPGILFGSLAGNIADRMKKVNIMVTADLLSSLLTFGLFFTNNLYIASILLFLRSTVALFNAPAQQTLTRYVVHEDHLLKATSLNGIVLQLGKVAGPLAGGAILAMFSAKLCILINAISSIISASILFTLLTIEENKPSESTDIKESKMDQFLGGWKIVFQYKILLHSFLFAMIGLFALQLVDLQFATLLRNFAADSPELLGYLIAASGFGAIVTITFMNRKKSIRYGVNFGLGFLLVGTGYASLGFLQSGMPHLYPVIAGFFIGAGNGLFLVAFNFLLQKETPKNAVGRVFGIQNTLSSFIMITAPLIGGYVVDLIGVQLVLLTIGVLLCAFGIAGFAFQHLIWPRTSSSTKAKPQLPLEQQR